MKVSKTGYKKNSKDKNQPSLLIPSNQITMKGVEFPVLGTDNTGYSQMMYPGLDYSFPGSYVYELPVKQDGGYILPGRYKNPEGNWLNKYAGGGDISIPNLSRGWLDKYQDGSEVPANLPWINSQGQYQEPVKTSKALSDDDLRRVDISEVSETTDTPAVRLAQKVAVQQREDWQNRKPIAKKPVSKKQNYNAKIAAYSRAEDKKVIDTYYKKYDESNQDQVKAIQAELVAKNFLPGPAAVDGKFGDKTKEAYLKYKTAERVGDLSGETEKSTCSYDGCAEYVSSVTRPYGWVLGDAWTMKNNIETNGGTVKYNIYTDPRFSRVKSKDQLKNVTEAVKRNNKATADMFQVGDVVGLYYKGSNMHQTALKDGRGTYNTHVGVVTEIKDGKPVISHNIHGKLHHDPYDNLTIGWVGTPAPRMAKYKPSKQPETLKDKINIYSKELTEILAPGVDSEKIANNIKGILRKETGLGKLKPTDADIEEIKARRDFLGESADIKDISRGIGKLKTATIPDDMKYFLGINDENIDDDAGVKAAVYKYVDAYNQFKAYSQNNPQLNLTDEDLHQMSILAYNQGTDKLMNLGYNNPTMPISSEVDALRDLYSGNIRDISSTNFKYLPSIDTYVGGIPINIDPGQALYDSRYPEGHESYISRVNKYANTPIEELEASVPKRKEKLRPVFKKLGGWLDKYQEGGDKMNYTYSDEFGTYMLPEVTVKPSISPEATEAILNREAGMSILPAPSTFDRRAAQTQYMLSNPLDALGHYSKYGYVPQGNLGNYGMREKSSPVGQLLMDFNPYNWANAAYRASIRGGDPDTYTTVPGAINMGADVAEALPVISELGPLLKGVKSATSEAGKYLTTQTPLKNAYKYNPWAFKVNENNWYRQVGKSAIDDASESGVIREAGEEVSPRMWAEFDDQIKRLRGEGIEDSYEKMKQSVLASRRPASPFFLKGELFYPMGRKPTITKTGKVSKNPAGKGSSDYLIETSLPNESFQPAYVKGMDLGVPEEIGTTAILKPNPDLRGLENFNFYKQDWLRGYKPITVSKKPSNSQELDVIRDLLKKANRRQIEIERNVKPVQPTISQNPYLVTSPILTKEEDIIRDSYNRNRWSNDPGFWRWYNKKHHDLDYDRPIKTFYDPSDPASTGNKMPPKKKLGGWLDRYQDGSQIRQSWKDKYDWTPNVEEEYQKFKNDPNAPENLRFTDDMKDYNTRGMWDSLDRPSNWQQALELFKQQQGYEWTPEEDGYYHAWSQHPGTGEWLKPRHHSTGWMNYMGYAFDPENTVVVNPEGFFGNETLQAYPKEKKKAGGMSPSMGYFNYIGGYRGMLP